MGNAHNMGEEIASSYVTEEEYNFEVYQLLIDIGSQYIVVMPERDETQILMPTLEKVYMRNKLRRLRGRKNQRQLWKGET